MTRAVAYYNEIDPYAAAWLRNLIAAGLIPPGDVDERDIREVCPDDLDGYTECHFFAGIGGWPYALRFAGWPNDRPVWTGSCPCQPFSGAGKRAGFDDERHLWPEFFRLIRECRPATVLGEQVASKDGLAWLNLVQADLEGANYATGAVDICAAGVGAPHIRQRLWWVGTLADAAEQGRGAQSERNAGEMRRQAPQLGRLRDACELGHTNDTRLEGRGLPGRERSGERALGPSGSDADRLEHAASDGRGQGTAEFAGLRSGNSEERQIRRSPFFNSVSGFWSDADWISCTDGKARPVEPGTFPLAHGVPNRVGRLRAYGNAIVPQVAAEFIGAFMEARP